MEKFKIIIVEDIPLELKGTEGIIRNDIPEAERNQIISDNSPLELY